MSGFTVLKLTPALLQCSLFWFDHFKIIATSK